MTDGDDASRRAGRRGTRRPRLATAIGVLVLLGGTAGVGFGVGVVLLHRTAGQRRQAAAHKVVTGYLTAWSSGDYPVMARLSTGTAAVIGALDAADRTALGVTAASYQLDGVARPVASPPGVLAASFTARLALQGLGTWVYNGTVPLEDVGGRWQVRFSPAAIHPQLTPGLSLGRTAVEGRRGRLLSSTGTRLRGADQEIDTNVLGTVGRLTAEQATRTPGRRPGEVAGQSGLERAYDSQLGGRPGGNVVLRRGAVDVATLARFPAVDGRDVRTTLNLAMQHAGESAISAGSLPAAFAAVDTRTGAVLAVANNPAGGYSRVLRGSYPPGSTFKIVTATAALTAGFTEQSVLQCPQTVQIAGFTFKNAMNEALGPISLRTAFAQSCNTAFVNLRE